MSQKPHPFTLSAEANAQNGGDICSPMSQKPGTRMVHYSIAVFFWMFVYSPKYGNNRCWMVVTHPQIPDLARTLPHKSVGRLLEHFCRRRGWRRRWGCTKTHIGRTGLQTDAVPQTWFTFKKKFIQIWCNVRPPSYKLVYKPQYL